MSDWNNHNDVSWWSIFWCIVIFWLLMLLLAMTRSGSGDFGPGSCMGDRPMVACEDDYPPDDDEQYPPDGEGRDGEGENYR